MASYELEPVRNVQPQEYFDAGAIAKAITFSEADVTQAIDALNLPPVMVLHIVGDSQRFYSKLHIDHIHRWLTSDKSPSKMVTLKPVR